MNELHEQTKELAEKAQKDGVKITVDPKIILELMEEIENLELEMQEMDETPR
uniref:Uncharacterized protein n=1 Tax=viral metagenome TaxID=1070528 RepID=A0A6M3LMZ0_9ZZZZ